MVYLIAIRTFLYSAVEEKAERYKETLRIMGVSDGAYQFSWFLYLLFKCAFVLLVVTIPTMATSSYETSGTSNGEAFGINCLYVLCCMA
jgi:hypothetical protein